MDRKAGTAGPKLPRFSRRQETNKKSHMSTQRHQISHFREGPWGVGSESMTIGIPTCSCQYNMVSIHCTEWLQIAHCSYHQLSSFHQTPPQRAWRLFTQLQGGAALRILRALALGLVIGEGHEQFNMERGIEGKP